MRARARSPWAAFLALLFGSALLFVPSLGARDFWYPDEPHIGEVPRAMYVSGDWVAPRSNGEIWVDYPPLLYWAGNLTSHLLGELSEFSLRLASALGAIALVLVTFLAGARALGTRAGLWAGVILMTSSQFVYGAISYRPDMLFSLAIGAGLLSYAAGFGRCPSRAWRVAGFALFGLAILGKGPLGLLLPGLILAGWHATRREWRALFTLAPLSLIALAVAAPWYLACARAMGPDVFWGEVLAQNLGRFGSGSRGHEKPFYYYLYALWINLGPWLFALPFALRWLVRGGMTRDRNVQLALWWFGASVLFLSAAATKREVYLMPAYPAAALLLAAWFARPIEASRTRADRALARGLAGIAFAIAGVLVVAGSNMEWIIRQVDVTPVGADGMRAAGIPLVGTGILSLVLARWIGRAAWSARPAVAYPRVALCLIPFYLSIQAWITPALNTHKSYVPQCEWIASQIGESTHVGLYVPERLRRKRGAFGFYTRRLVRIVDSPEALEAFFREHPESIGLVSHSMGLDTVEQVPAAQVVRDFEIGRYPYYAVQVVAADLL